MSENITSGTAAQPCGCPCSEAKQHVWDYLDGEMADGDCGRIRAHLADCDSCRETYDSEQRMKDAVSRACGCDQAPQDLKSKVLAMVDALRREACSKGAKTEAD